VNILIVTQYFWPESFRINDLALGLKEKGHHITVLTGIPNYPEGRFFSGYGFLKKRVEDYQGIKVFRAPLLPRGNGGPISLVLNYLSFAICASIMVPFIDDRKFDLIFVYQASPVTVGLPALLLKKQKKFPIMFWVQDLWPESLSATGAVRSERVLKIVEKLVRFIYSGCDRILIQSKAFSPLIEKLGVESSRILYFPNSAEKHYKPVNVDQNASERAVLPNGFKVMFAGNIGAAQDFSTILDAAEKVKGFLDLHWVIIGDGRLRTWVEAQIIKRGLMRTVHLLGRYPVEAMPQFFSLADALLVTLKKEPIFELTIPSKVQSYLACAKPIIAALDGEGARVIKEAGAGLTCPAEDPDALVEAVLSLYGKSEDERCLIGERGRRYFEQHFERDMLLTRLEKLMMEFVAC